MLNRDFGKLFGKRTHNKLLTLAWTDMIEGSCTTNIEMVSFSVNICKMLFRHSRDSIWIRRGDILFFSKWKITFFYNTIFFRRTNGQYFCIKIMDSHRFNNIKKCIGIIEEGYKGVFPALGY